MRKVNKTTYKFRKGIRNKLEFMFICLGMLLGSKEMVYASNTFTILEIVSHDSASIFSYYSEDTIASSPLGEEGLMIAVNNYNQGSLGLLQNEKPRKFENLKPITILEDEYVHSSLSDLIEKDETLTYQELVARADVKWKIKETEEVYKNPVGYFEYIGEEGYGLYKFNDWQHPNYEYAIDKEKGKGNYNLVNLTGFTSHERGNGGNGHGGNGHGSKTVSGKDFNISFSSEQNVEFETENSQFGFAKNRGKETEYGVKEATLNQDKGEYYKKSVDDRFFIYDKDQTLKEKNGGVGSYYKVIFKTPSSKGEKYYIDKIEVAENEKGLYYARSDNSRDACMHKTEVGEGIYSKHIESLPISAINTQIYSPEDLHWIWVTSEDGKTKKSLESDYLEPKVGTKIYLDYSKENRGDKFKKNHYTQNGYVNNELFKLYCMNYDDFEDYVDINDWDEDKLKAQEVVGLMKEEIEAINLECIVKTPDEVTQADIDKADLVYFGDGYAILEFGNLETWNHLTGSSETEIPDTYGEGQDLDTFKMVSGLYEEFYYKRKAIIMSSNIRDHIGGKNTNIYKLFAMLTYFDNSNAFGSFYPNIARPERDMILKEAPNEVLGNFCSINADTGEVMLSNNGTNYNPIRNDKPFFTLPGDADWKVEYFILHDKDGSITEENPFLGYESSDDEEFEHNDDNDYDINEYEDDFNAPKIIVGWDLAEAFGDGELMEEIFDMLQDVGGAPPTITFPNAEKDALGNSVQYISDFQTIFNIDFKVESKSKNISKIELKVIPSSGLTAHSKNISCSPNVRVYERNSLLPLEGDNSNGNNDLDYKVNRAKTGYEASNPFGIIFPNPLLSGMEAKITIEVTYGTNQSASKEIMLKVRDSFDLN